MPVRLARPPEHPHVALVTLDRPEKANALDPGMLCELAETWRTLAADDAIRAIVLTGAGERVFCSGMDMRATIPVSQALARGEKIDPADFEGLRSVSTALLCDVRVAARSASMGFPELGRGIPPSLGAAMRVLPPGFARQICLTGRVLTADEACSHGIVTSVVDDDAVVGEAVRVASEIAARDPRAIGTVVNWTRAPAADWREQLDRERALLRSSLLGSDPD